MTWRVFILAVLLALGAGLAGEPLAQDEPMPLAGRWQVAHQDRALGVVKGTARVAADERSVRVELVQPGTGVKYALTSTRFQRQGDRVRVTLKGAGAVPENYRFVPWGQPVRVADGARSVPVRLGNGKGALAILDSQAADLDTVELDLAIGKTTLSGTWSYRADAQTGRDRSGGGRTGIFELSDDGSGTAIESGAESWTRPAPKIAFAVPLQDQLAFLYEGYAKWPYPFRAGKAGPVLPLAEWRTLFVVGENLPTEVGDPVKIESLDPNVRYGVRAKQYDFDVPAVRQWVDKGWQRLEETLKPAEFAEVRKMDGILLSVEMSPGVIPGLHGFKLNGAEGNWKLRFGDYRAKFSFVRAVSDEETEPVTHAFRPDRLYVELRSDVPLVFKEIPVLIGLNGDIKAFSAGREVPATPVDESRKVYRTPPIYLYDRTRSAFAEAAPYSFAVENGEVLTAAVGEKDWVVASPGVARVEVVQAPAEIGKAVNGPAWPLSLIWKEAVAIAAACAGKPVLDWDQTPQAEAKQFTNLVLLRDWVGFKRRIGADRTVRRISLKLGDHAAMLMLRSVFLEMMEVQRRELAKFSGADMMRGFRLAYEFAASEPTLPLAEVRVTPPPKYEATTSRKVWESGEIVMALALSPTNLSLVTFREELAEFGKIPYWYSYSAPFLDEMFGADKEAAEAWQLRAASEAFDGFAAAIGQAMTLARKPGDCAVEELLKLTGNGFAGVASALKPRLMRLVERANPRRLEWEYDPLARAYVLGVETLAEAVRAQTDLAEADTKRIFIALSVGLLPAMFSECAVWAAISLTADVTDIAYEVFVELPQALENRVEVRFARGASAVLGSRRYVEAVERDESVVKVAASLYLNLATFGLGALDSYDTITRARSIEAGKKSVEEGLTAAEAVELAEAQRVDVLNAVIDTKRLEAALGAAALEPAELSVLDLAEELARTLPTGQPEWAEALDGPTYALVADTARLRPDVQKLVETNPGPMSAIINDDVGRETLRGAPFDDIAGLRKAVADAKKKTPPKGADFYRYNDADNPDLGPWEVQPKKPGTSEPYEDHMLEYNPATGVERVPIYVDEVVVYKGGVYAGNYTRGLTRAPDGKGQMLVMKEAFLEPWLGADKWIAGAKLPLVGGRGTPINTYMNLRAMNRLGIDYGDPLLTVAQLSNVLNARTAIGLYWLRRAYPDVPLNDLVKYTHSYDYARSALEQAGFRIVGAKVESVGFSFRAVELLKPPLFREGADEAAKILRRYEIAPDAVIDCGQDIFLKVEPIPGGG